MLLADSDTCSARCSTIVSDVPDTNVLLLTAAIGSGHVSATEALAAHLHPEAKRVDSCDLTLGATSLSRAPSAYQYLTTRQPLLWHGYFALRQRSTLVRKLVRSSIRADLLAVLDAIDLGAYTDVVLTHSLYTQFARDISQRGPRVSVYCTDVFGGPEEWFDHPAHLFVVPSRQQADRALARNVQGPVIIRRMVTRAPRRPRLDIASLSVTKILIAGGGTGAGRIEGVLSAVLETLPHARVVVSTGSNERLRSHLSGTSPARVEVRGYISEMAREFADYSLVITKPGSVTLMEISDVNVPFILIPGIPGIESGTTVEYCRRLGVRRLRTERMFRHWFTPDGVTTKEGARAIQAGLDLLAELPDDALRAKDLPGWTE